MQKYYYYEYNLFFTFNLKVNKLFELTEKKNNKYI